MIVSKTFEENKIKIRNLNTKEAVFASKQIDTFNYTTKELVKKLEELSATAIVT